MNTPYLSLLVSPVVVVTSVLVVGAAAPVAAGPPTPTFGSHVASCAHGTGFSGQHNPSHHRGPAPHGVDGMHC